MEIAALPSCEKSFFAGAKVTFFWSQRVTKRRFFFMSVMTTLRTTAPALYLECRYRVDGDGGVREMEVLIYQ